MRRVLVLMCLLMFSVSLFGQNKELLKEEGCLIKGVLNGVYKGEKVYLLSGQEIGGETTVIDSCAVVDNTYTFTIKNVEIPRMYFIKSGDPECLSPITPVWVEKGTVRVKADAEFFMDSDVRGTANNEILSAYNAGIRYFMDSIRRTYNINVLLNRNQLPEELERDFKVRSVSQGMHAFKLQEALVRNYHDQAMAPFMIFWEMKKDVSLERLKELRALLSPSLEEHPYTKQLEEFIRLADFKEGSEVPNFTLPDKNGKNIELSSLRGKYVLIDFWASWCGPCIREMPNVVKLYKECKGKNFEILGISLDKDKDAWLSAVKKNKMEWIQLGDMKGWATLPVKLCNISAVPYTILVNPEGKVVALNLRGEQLIERVKEILKK